MTRPEWLNPAGGSIQEDILKMIERLQDETLKSPCTFYIPDESIRLMGGNPEDYPELEGHLGVRKVEAK